MNDEFLRPLLYGVGQPQECELPLRRRRVAPRLERLLRRPERRIDIGLPGCRRRGERFACGGVHEIVALPVGGIRVLTVHKVLDAFDLGLHLAPFDSRPEVSVHVLV
jgi:hypothetical protein